MSQEQTPFLSAFRPSHLRHQETISSIMSLTGLISLIKALTWPPPAGKRSKSPPSQAFPTFIMLYSLERSAPASADYRARGATRRTWSAFIPSSLIFGYNFFGGPAEVVTVLMPPPARSSRICVRKTFQNLLKRFGGAFFC